ncbi:MAG: LegC family aminotransferase [Methanotrichaceae archaeon]|nr:LegC family aminotransferase [Methanotrichaceae archaeon]
MPFEPGVPVPDGFVPLCVPEVRGNEWTYIRECLDTNFVSSVGPFVDRFEDTVKEYIGTKYAVATVNGTSALHIALLVSGIKPDDEVLVPTLTFIAPVNAIHYVGAHPVFIDAEPIYCQMDPQKVIDFLEKECNWVKGEMRNTRTGRRVKAILPVHILGHPVDMDPILEAARKYELIVIEDAAESLGSTYKSRKVGHLGDIACLSFNGNKIVTTGGGGMIVTDNKAWASRTKYLTTQAKDDPIEYVHKEIGYNYRLTNLQAAMGCAQMERLDEFINRKRRIADKYIEALEDVVGLVPIKEANWAFGTYWLFTILIHEKYYGANSRSLLKILEKYKIQSRPLWQPMHRSPAYTEAQSYRIDNADILYQDALSLPSSTGLNDSEQEKVIQILRNKRI